MQLRREPGTARPIRGTRSSSLFPLFAAVTSAIALTGVAVYTVDKATCASPAQYIRHDNHVELVGGCVDSSELPASKAGTQSGSVMGMAPRENYRP